MDTALPYFYDIDFNEKFLFSGSPWLKPFDVSVEFNVLNGKWWSSSWILNILAAFEFFSDW